MVKNITKFQVLRVSCKYFAIFNLIANLSTDITKLLQCKGIFFYVTSPDVMFVANVLTLYLFL